MHASYCMFLKTSRLGLNILASGSERSSYAALPARREQEAAGGEESLTRNIIAAFLDFLGPPPDSGAAGATPARHLPWAESVACMVAKIGATTCTRDCAAASAVSVCLDRRAYVGFAPNRCLALSAWLLPARRRQSRRLRSRSTMPVAGTRPPAAAVCMVRRRRWCSGCWWRCRRSWSHSCWQTCCSWRRL